MIICPCIGSREYTCFESLFVICERINSICIYSVVVTWRMIKIEYHILHYCTKQLNFYLHYLYRSTTKVIIIIYNCQIKISTIQCNKDFLLQLYLSPKWPEMGAFFNNLCLICCRQACLVPNQQSISQSVVR